MAYNKNLIQLRSRATLLLHAGRAVIATPALTAGARTRKRDALMDTTMRGDDMAARRTHLHHQIIPMHIVQVLEIQTLNLVLFLDAQMAPRDLIDHKQQDTADDETPRGTGCCCGELVPQLDPVVLPPAAGVCSAGGAVESGNPGRREEAC